MSATRLLTERQIPQCTKAPPRAQGGERPRRGADRAPARRGAGAHAPERPARADDPHRARAVLPESQRVARATPRPSRGVRGVHARRQAELRARPAAEREQLLALGVAELGAQIELELRRRARTRARAARARRL